MKILVTGGAGFIGSHLIMQLLEKRHEVVCVDNVNDYYEQSLKEARLARFEGKVPVYRIDITDLAALEKVFSEHQFDKIAHLAAQAGVRYATEHPEVYVHTNYVGTFHLYELAKKYGISHVLFASTSSVYGESPHMPFTEDDAADKPLTIYSASKRACEMMAYQYHYLHNINTTVYRFFSVYGPFGRPDMALFKFTKAILEGESIDVYNRGDMKRDFTYVSDIVDGFVSGIEKPMGFEIINLGHGKPTHLLSFIEIIERELGKEAIKNMMPMQPGDITETYANTEKARRLLGYAPKVSVEEGVKNFIEWYKAYYRI